jgi:hypothetical protein
MQVSTFIRQIRDNVWPDSSSNLDKCKTYFDVIIWKKNIINELGKAVVEGEEENNANHQQEEESKDEISLSFI